MSTAESWTVGKLLEWTTDYLRKHGSSSPRLDSEVLLAQARDCKRIELYTSFSEEPTEEVKVAFRELVRRRAEGTPVAYLVGHKEFYSLPFEVNSDVLIPRPETEHLVVEALDRAAMLRQSHADLMLHIADIGTGSGIIAVCLAKHLANCSLTAVDISPAALEVAQRNARRHGVADRIEFASSDLFDRISPEQRFEMIVSNPPYISIAEFDKLACGVRDYEPRQALLAGPTGTEIIQRLLHSAAERVLSRGYLIFEISPMIVDEVRALINPQVWELLTVAKDLAGLPRIVTLQRLPIP